MEIGIVGSTGYTGKELVNLLERHPEVDKESIHPFSRSQAGKRYSSITDTAFDKEVRHPETLSTLDPDLIFYAAPFSNSWFNEDLIKRIESGVKIISMCGKSRITGEKDRLEYGESPIDKEIYDERIYGLPEINRDQIKEARFIANPGCYPTSIVLALTPLADFKDRLDLSNITIDSTSGWSGAGTSPPQEVIEVKEGRRDLYSYNQGRYTDENHHRHVPEIEETLKEQIGRQVGIYFKPEVVRRKRGIISTIHTFQKGDKSLEETRLEEHYRQWFRDEPFVSISDEGWCINQESRLDQVRKTNGCTISINCHNKEIRPVSAIDNLGKGGSGQAIQNMNLLLGFDETAGLKPPKSLVKR